MRLHVHKTTLNLAVDRGPSIPLPVVLTFHVRCCDAIEIRSARVYGEDAPIWLLRRIESDAGLATALRAKADDDLADDRARAARADLARAA